MRTVKDAKDLSSNELIYFKGHAKATYMSNGATVEDAINNIEVGGGVDLSNYATKLELNLKQDIIEDIDTIRLNASNYKGTVTSIKINNVTKTPSNGVVDLGTVITSHQDISGKQDKLVSGTSIKTINGESILGSGDISISGGETGAVNWNDILNAPHYELGSDLIGATLVRCNQLLNQSDERLYFDATPSNQLSLLKILTSDGDNVFELFNNGDGTKFLSNDGTYKEVSGGNGILKTYIFHTDDYPIDQENEITQEEYENIMAADLVYMKIFNNIYLATDTYEEPGHKVFSCTRQEGPYTYNYYIRVYNTFFVYAFDMINLLNDLSGGITPDYLNFNQYLVQVDQIYDGLEIFIPAYAQSISIIESSTSYLYVLYLDQRYVDIEDTSDIAYGANIGYTGYYNNNSVLKACIREFDLFVLTIHEYVETSNLKTINGTSIVGSGNIVIEGGDSSSGSVYPLVNNGTSNTTFTLNPNIFYVWDAVSELVLDIDNEVAGFANEYIFLFISGGTATTLSLPETIKWASEPDILANKIYQVSILNNLGTILEFDL